MEQQFTADEIKDAARTARVYCHGFTEDMFESLMELERRVAEPGYLEVVQALIRLEEEKGISCTEALDACEKLLEQKAKLEREVPDLEKRVESLVAQIKQANAEYEQVKKDVTKAEQALARIRGDYVSAEKKLEAFNRKAEKEKQRIEKEVEDCYRQANVTKEEIMTAGKVKAEAESHDFTLELVLDLSKEFAGHKNARKELAAGLKDHGSLNKYLDNLAEWGNKERARMMAEIAGLESQKKGIADENICLGNALSQLQADIAGEEELRRFYFSYYKRSVLLDILMSWDQIFFVRCNNPSYKFTGMVDRKLGNAQIWTDKLPTICPHCGYQTLLFDEKVYQALNWPIGAPYSLTME